MIGGTISAIISTSSALGKIIATGTKTTDPSVSGVNTIPENNSVTIRIENYNSSQRYIISVPVGTVTQDENNPKDWIWKLPYVSSNINYEISVRTEGYGELSSDIVTHNVLVTEGLFSADLNIVNNAFQTNELIGTDITYG